MFIVPCTLVTTMTLLGIVQQQHTQQHTGIFTPGMSSLERDRKIDIGLTALLTMAVVLLMLNDMIPNTHYSEFPWLGWVLLTCCIYPTMIYRPLVYHGNSADLCCYNDQHSNHVQSVVWPCTNNRLFFP
jgi:hypothetical protein